MNFIMMAGVASYAVAAAIIVLGSDLAQDCVIYKLAYTIFSLNY